MSARPQRIAALTAAAATFAITASVSAGTLAYWRFETGPADSPVLEDGTPGYVYSPDVPDASGNGNELAMFDTGGGTGFAYRADVPAGYLDNSFSIQNTGGFPATFTDPAAAISNDAYAAWTVEASWKPENGGFRTVVGRDAQGVASADGGLAALYLSAQPDGSLAIKYTDEAGNFHVAASAPGVVQGFDFGSDPTGSTGTWHNIAATSDGSTLRLYLDTTGYGQYNLVAQLDVSGSADSALTDGFTSVGGVASGGGWSAGDWTVGRGLYAGGHGDRAFGFIDEVRLSDSALSSEQFVHATLTGSVMSQAVAIYQMNDTNDDNFFPQNSAFTAEGSFTIGNTNNTSVINAINSDGFAANEGAGTSFGLRNLGPDGTEELQIAGSLSVFARVRMGAFNGVDDIVRVGEQPYPGLDYFGLEFLNGQARFNITADGLTNPPPAGLPTGFETTALHASVLSPDTWYDITGVFDADAQTMTIYVFDPVSGQEVGTAFTIAVPFDEVETQFGGILSNLLFLEAPGNFNGENLGGQLELVGIWAQALSARQVAALSAVVPAPAALPAGLALLGLTLARRRSTRLTASRR